MWSQPDNVFQDLVKYLKAGHMKPKPEVVFKGNNNKYSFIKTSDKPQMNTTATTGWEIVNYFLVLLFC